jgi:hypothetical protein
MEITDRADLGGPLKAPKLPARGHEKVLTGGQFEGITFGQIKVPTPR